MFEIDCQLGKRVVPLLQLPQLFFKGIEHRVQIGQWLHQDSSCQLGKTVVPLLQSPQLFFKGI